MNTKTLVVLALAVVLTGSFAGCAAAEAPTPSATQVTVDPGRVSPTDLPTPPVVKDAQGDIKDLTLGECPTEKGQQVVSGSLTSTLPGKADFLVTVSWTTATGDVMGRGFQVIQNLKPGEIAEIAISAKVSAGATQCVSGVEYGTIKS